MTNNPLEFFEKVYCINLDEREDRWQYCTGEFIDLGIINYERFSASKADILPDGSLGAGKDGHTKTYCALIDKAIADNVENCVILEDDFNFIVRGKELYLKISEAVEQLPSNWDLLYFGANIHTSYTSTPLQKYSKALFKLNSAYTTHAIAFSRRGLVALRNCFSGRQDWYLEYLQKSSPADIFLARDFLAKNNAYITTTFLCSQLPDYSNIENCYTNYTDMLKNRFEEYSSQLNKKSLTFESCSITARGNYMNNSITFIIAVQLDCKDRLDNLQITLDTIFKGFPDCQVLLLEADTVNKLEGRYPGCEHVFVKLRSGEVFNKMKLYNKGAKLARGSVLCFVDVDVPPSKTAVLEAYKLITSNIYDVVFPYGKAEGYNIPKQLHDKVKTSGDVHIYDESKYPWLSKSYQMPYVESGGVILYNATAYLYGGGGNENFLGWGCEDDEALARFAGLGYRLGRLDNYILLHLQHERAANPLWYDYSKYESANRHRLAVVRGMNREELRAMVEGWNNFGNPYGKTADVTVIISGSYLDSHPSITFVQEVIESLELTGIPHSTPLILSHDKIKPGTEGIEEKEKAYQEYFKNLEEYIKTSSFKNITISQAPEWGHLTRTLKYAVSQVKTKYMLVLQHDIHIRREIPVLKMIDLMEQQQHIKHLRFNVRRNHPTFMWWDGYHKDGHCIFAEEEYDGVKLCITPAWSDQNHLATKEYYENVVFPDCRNPDGELIHDFMENKLNGLCHHDHSRYGTYIYGEYGAPRTSRHSDGRKSSPEADED